MAHGLYDVGDLVSQVTEISMGLKMVVPTTLPGLMEGKDPIIGAPLSAKRGRVTTIASCYSLNSLLREKQPNEPRQISRIFQGKEAHKHSPRLEL